MSKTIAIIGGTGPQGKGLGLRFAQGGHRVILGSRSAERAQAAATELAQEAQVSADQITGADNAAAAAAGDMVLLAVPYKGHDELVESLAPQLAGKVVISCVNPLGFDKKGPYGLNLGEDSAAESAQRLAPQARVVGAFHHLSAPLLISGASLADEDVLVCGDDQEAKAEVIDLSTTVTGKAGVDAGALRLARQLEPLTAVLISINKRYKVNSGVKIAGLER